jgi:FKBP-type peptidyl-prolyl cis-trans isomerase FkpA
MKRIIFFLLLLATSYSCKKDKTDYTETDKQIILDYIASHHLTAKSTSSGLYYVIEKPGSDHHPTIYSTVTVSYTGRLSNDTVFDGTASGSSATFALTSVIAGWQEGIPLFGIGGKGKLLVPSALGYGSSGSYGVPENSVLIFDIELVDFY